MMGITVVLAVILSGLVFSGLLTFRYSDYDDLMARGQQLLSEGKVARAAQVFEGVLNQYGEGYPVYLNLGKVYLELDQPAKAQEVLEAALKLKSPSGSVDALLAKSQLLVVNKDYTKAIDTLQDHLMTLEKDDPGREPLNTMLADVYTYWADAERKEDHLAQAITYYEEALGFVTSYHQEQSIQADMTDVALLISEQHLLAKAPEKLIEDIAPMMDWSNDPTLMIRLAEAYQQTNQLDKAIHWYRQAFDAEPENIRGKLSQVLLARGRELAADEQGAMAEPYFNEAEALVSSVGDDTAKAMLYPVRISQFQIQPNLNRGEKTLSPVATFTVISEAHRPISELSARLQYRIGPNVLASNIKLIAGLDNPLGSIGEKDAKRTLKIGINNPIPVGEYGGKTVTAELALAYADGVAFANVNWQAKALQDIAIREASETYAAADDDNQPEAGQQHVSLIDGQTTN
jgi:tetratricopeptide (TPR) repeat protein